jgi:glycosyltransferase involved in cell wall biosynthesis
MRRKEFPDTLLMGLNHLPDIGSDMDVVSLAAGESRMHAFGRRIIRELREVDVCLENPKWIRDLHGDVDWLMYQYLLPLPFLNSYPFGILDVIAYNGQPFQRFLAALSKRASFVTCNSRAEVDLLVGKFGLDASRVWYIPWGIDADFYKPQAGDSILGGTEGVIAVGNANRDYVTVARALRALDRKVECTIVLGGPLKFRPGEPPYSIDSLREIYPRIKILDRCHPQELRSLYSKASVVVVPVFASIAASGVTALLEGMAMEKTCVVADSPGLEDYVDDGDSTLIYRPGDVASLATAFDDCFNERLDADAIRRRSRLSVESRFSTLREGERLSAMIAAAESQGVSC